MNFYKSILLFLCILLPACSTIAPRAPNPINMNSRVVDDDSAAWRNCHFRIAWPEGAAPRWGVDLLVAHKILGPILSRQANEIYRWRFHRRSNRDEAGHQFSFVYYAGSAEAQTIISAIQQSQWRQRLLENEVLESAACETADNMSRQDIGDGSDENWSESMQRHWPAYIMGVSNLWLGLIDDAIVSLQPDEHDLDKTLQAYDEAGRIVSLIWRNESQHALLHHLNAVFGYEEMLIRF